MSHSSSFASFATLDEAWGGVGVVHPPPVCVPPRSRPESVPAPSDMDYSRSGAPIMDDIVNLYTPPNVPVCTPRPVNAPSLAVAPVQSDPAIQKVIRREGRGDDYSESEDEEEGPSVTAARRRGRGRGREQGQGQGQGLEQRSSNNDTAAGIELAAYVLSGVLLIFMFESFITLGGSLRYGGVTGY